MGDAPTGAPMPETTAQANKCVYRVKGKPDGDMQEVAAAQG